MLCEGIIFLYWKASSKMTKFTPLSATIFCTALTLFAHTATSTSGNFRLICSGSSPQRRKSSNGPTILYPFVFLLYPREITPTLQISLPSPIPLPVSLPETLLLQTLLPAASLLQILLSAASLLQHPLSNLTSISV